MLEIIFKNLEIIYKVFEITHNMLEKIHYEVRNNSQQVLGCDVLFTYYLQLFGILYIYNK